MNKFGTLELEEQILLYMLALQKKASQTWCSLIPRLVTEGIPGRLIPPPQATEILLIWSDPATTSNGAQFGVLPKISGQEKHSYSPMGLRTSFLPRDTKADGTRQRDPALAGTLGAFVPVGPKSFSPPRVTRCYEVHVCVPTFTYWSPNPQCGSIWRWDL